MKKMMFLIVLVLTVGAVSAQTWTVDKAHAKLGFGITHLMVSQVDGNFKTFDATITSSKDDLSDAVFDISADAASVDTGNENRDKDIKGANYFDVEKFPKLTFKSKSFTKVEGNKYKLSGDITIKGVTKPADFDVVLTGPIVHPRSKKPVIGLKVTGIVKRTDFGVGGSGGAIISEDVQLIANGEFGKN